MTHTTNDHDGGAPKNNALAGETDSTSYTWARRSDIAPPAPSSSGQDIKAPGYTPAGQPPPAGSVTGPPAGSPPDSPAAGGDQRAPEHPAPVYAPPTAWSQPGQNGAPAYVQSPPYARQASGPAPGEAPGSPAPYTPYGITSTMPIPGYPTPGSGGHGPDLHGSGFSGQPPLPPAQREARRPGWGGVVAMGAGAAVLASLLTAGIITSTDDGASPASISTSQNAGPQVKAPVTSSNNASPDWGAVAGAVEPSVVAVAVTSGQAEGEGSGVILDKTGRIVTNNHVVSGAGAGAKVTVTLWDGRGYDATVVGTDPSTDLAVIKISSPPSNLTPAVLGSSNSVQVGDPVMAVGNPLGLAGTVTTGIVSATDRPVTTEAESSDPTAPGGNDTVFTNSIQTDAAVNPGNSGGALVDAQGRVVGIPSSIASLGSSSAFGQSSQSGNIGLGFAIPIDEVKNVTSQLIDSGTVKHAWLGVGTGNVSVTVEGATREAASLREIQSGSPAAKAGLKDGDAVIAVDGEAVNGANSLIGQLRQRTPGTAVKLSVVRGGQTQEITVSLGTRPTSAN